MSLSFQEHIQARDCRLAAYIDHSGNMLHQTNQCFFTKCNASTGPGPQQHMMNYMGNTRPYSDPPYGMMQGQGPYMMYNPPQMNSHGPNMRPPAHSQGFQGAMHYGAPQVPMHQAMSASLDPQNSSGQIPYPNSNKQ